MMPLTPSEYRALRLSIRLTGRQCAEALGISNVTLSRREHGYAPIDIEASLALMQIAAQYRSDDRGESKIDAALSEIPL